MHLIRLISASILQIHAYEGNLTLYTKHEIRNGEELAQPFSDPLIILSGNGMTLILKNENSIPSGKDNGIRGWLIEDQWLKLEGGIKSAATRSDIMFVLASIDRILIRASHGSNMKETRVR